MGVALASDIELFENLPLNYVSYCQRQHRWIRGRLADRAVDLPAGAQPQAVRSSRIRSRW